MCQPGDCFLLIWLERTIHIVPGYLRITLAEGRGADGACHGCIKASKLCWTIFMLLYSASWPETDLGRVVSHNWASALAALWAVLLGLRWAACGTGFPVPGDSRVSHTVPASAYRWYNLDFISPLFLSWVSSWPWEVLLLVFPLCGLTISWAF